MVPTPEMHLWQLRVLRYMDLIATHDPSNIPEPRYIYSVLYIQPSGEVWEGFAKEYKQVNPKWTIK